MRTVFCLVVAQVERVRRLFYISRRPQVVRLGRAAGSAARSGSGGAWLASLHLPTRVWRTTLTPFPPLSTALPILPSTS